MTIEITLSQGIALSISMLLLVGLTLTSLRHWKHLRAVARTRELAARLRGPATSLADVEQQSTAVEELAQFGHSPAAIAAARELLDSMDAAMRSAAIEVLRSTRAFDRWVRDLHRGGYRAKLRAIEALGQVGDERAVEELLLALGHDDPDVARAASYAIVARDPDYASDRLADALGSPNRRIAQTAAATLVRMGEDATEALLSQLTSLNPQARRLAAESLGAVGGPNICGLLCPLLDSDPDPGVRVAAAHALARLGDGTSLERLRQLADSDPDWFVRARAYSLLAEVNAPGAADFLSRALARIAPEVANCRPNDDEVEAVTDGSPRIHSAIIAGLRLLGLSDDEIAAAERLAGEPRPEEEIEPEVSHAEDQRAELIQQLRERDPVRRAEAARQLADAGKLGSPTLAHALGDPDPLVRAEAARSLGRIGARDCLDALAECLRDPDSNVRLVASNAMRAIVMQHAAQELRD